MWARRQAHETAVHRVDAELAAGQAVMALREGLEVECLSIWPDGGSDAFVDVSEPILRGAKARVRTDTFRIARGMLAGPA